MDKHYTYLLINFFTIIFPLLLSFDKRVQFYKSWPYVFPAMLLAGLFFIGWDSIFTHYEVWGFNPEYTTGYQIGNLPLEEVLFFITVPFACIFVYECLNYYVRKDILGRYSRSITLALAALSVIMLIAYYDRLYTLVTFALLLCMSLYLLYSKPAYLGRFYLAFLVSMFPFYIVNGILTSFPVVVYNTQQTMDIRVGTVPLEDHLYSLSMLLMNILIFEHFRKRSSQI